jgi:uncharacterized protein (TIGR02647 family)
MGYKSLQMTDVIKMSVFAFTWLAKSDITVGKSVRGQVFWVYWHTNAINNNQNSFNCREVNMALTNDLIQEMELLLKFDLSSARVGLKIHSNADPKLIAAAKRLHEKELVEHEDGGFLTTLGHEAAEHLLAARLILTSPVHVD